MENIINTVQEVTITGIEPYGAFVQLSDGRKGLLHISEISYEYVNDINDFVSRGDKINVKVIDIVTDGNLRVSLKALQQKSARKRRRYVPSITHKFKIGFKSLEEQLPNWLEKLEEKYGN